MEQPVFILLIIGIPEHRTVLSAIAPGILAIKRFDTSIWHFADCKRPQW